MELVKLKELVTYRKQFIEISDNEKYKRCRVQLHRRGVKLRDEVFGYEIKTKKQRLCKSNDFIVAEMDAKCGGYGIIPEYLNNAIVSSHYYLYELDTNKLIPMFLDIIIDSGIFQEQIKAVGSTNYSRVSAKEVLEYEIPCPSLQMQQQVVNHYFKCKDKATVLGFELTHQQTLLKKLRQQILQEAIEGKLTADWRAKHSPPLEGCPEGVGWFPLEGCPKGGVVNSRNTKNYKSLPYNPKLKARARELRKAGNLSEVLFWNQVKRKQFNGLDFDRQKIIGNYIVDFYCANLQIVIEIDGASHDNKQEYDAQRDAYLEGLGLTVIHILDSEIKKNLSGVMSWLRRHDGFQVCDALELAHPTSRRLEENTTTPTEVPPHPSGTLLEGTTPPLRGTPPKEGNWECASELLNRIQTEKAQLIAQGKIKKPRANDLPASRQVSEEEKPFDLPEGWVWCRLAELGEIKGGGTPSKGNSEFWDGNIPWICPKDMKAKYLSESIFQISPDAIGKSSAKLITENSILFVVRGMILSHTFPVAINTKPATMNQDMKALSPFINEMEEYLYLLLRGNADHILKQVKTSTHGTCRLESDIYHNWPVGLPPLPEQKAIVTKVEKLLALCDQLESQITANQTHVEQLMQAVLKEAFDGNN